MKSVVAISVSVPLSSLLLGMKNVGLDVVGGYSLVGGWIEYGDFLEYVLRIEKFGIDEFGCQKLMADDEYLGGDISGWW